MKTDATMLQLLEAVAAACDREDWDAASEMLAVYAEQARHLFCHDQIDLASMHRLVAAERELLTRMTDARRLASDQLAILHNGARAQRAYRAISS